MFQNVLKRAKEAKSLMVVLLRANDEIFGKNKIKHAKLNHANCQLEDIYSFEGVIKMLRFFISKLSIKMIVSLPTIF